MMSNRRQKQLMQEALDENLSPQSRNELFNTLDEDVRASAEFERLKEVDTLLRHAPHERAPKDMATNIMARLGAMAQRLNPEQLSHISGLATAIALSLVGLVSLSLFVAIIWGVLSIITSTDALNQLMQGLASLIGFMVNSFGLVLDSLRGFMGNNPELQLVAFTAVPASIIWAFWRSRRNRADKST
jgi:hypothetical protein